MTKNKLYILISIIILLAILLFMYFIINNINSVNNSKAENLNTEYITSENNEHNEQLNYKFFERGFIPYDDMTYFNNIYYKQLNSLDEYNEFKSKVASLPECETDFDKNFNVVIMTENVSTQYLVPFKIYDEDNKLYIGLIKDFNTNPNSNAIILEISRGLGKDTIEPYKAIKEDIPYTDYTPIKELPENYSAENAVNDNCYVEESIEHLNQKLVEEFLNNYNNSKDAFIRIVRISEDKEIIMDVYYSANENKFLVCVDNSRAVENTTYNYYKYSNLNKETLAIGRDGSSDYYSLTDSSENNMFLFYI